MSQLLDVLFGGGAESPLDRIIRQSGFTPGINPTASHPLTTLPGNNPSAGPVPMPNPLQTRLGAPESDMAALARQNNFGGNPVTSNVSDRRISATADRNTRGERGIEKILGSLGGPGRAVRDFISPATNALGTIMDVAEGAAAKGGLSSIAPNFSAGVQAAAQQEIDNALQRAQVDYYRARSQPKPSEQFEVLTPEQEAEQSLDPNASYKRNLLTNEVSRIGGAGTTVNVGENQTPTSVWDLSAPQLKIFTDARESAVSDQITRQASGTALTILNSQDAPFTGAAQPLQQLGANILDVFASEDSTDADVLEARRKLAASGAMDSQTGIMVGQIIRLFGSGTGLSDADREFASKIAGALRTGTKGELNAILTGAFERSTKGIESFNTRITGTGLNDMERLLPLIEMQEFDFSPVQEGDYIRPDGVTDAAWAQIMADPKTRNLFRKDSEEESP